MFEAMFVPSALPLAMSAEQVALYSSITPQWQQLLGNEAAAWVPGIELLKAKVVSQDSKEHIMRLLPNVA